MNRSSLLIRACLVAITAAACSGSSKKLDLGGQCIQNSDCNNPLACKFEACHQQCAESRDCPKGERCVAAEGIGVCQTQAESVCGPKCVSPMVCSTADNTCRSACTNSAGCLSSQICTDSFCVDKPELAGTDGAVGAGVGAACTTTSDCASSFLCKFGSCHQACTASTECAVAGRCVTVSGVAFCQLSGEAACGAGGACAAGLACRPVDNTCRSACSSSAGCLTGQTCTDTVCVDNTEVAGNDGSAGAGGGADAGSAADGIDAAASGIDSRTDVTVDGPPAAGACTGKIPSYFGQVATSDFNPNYTSGVGLLTATEFLTFNAYVGPASTDGGVPDGGTGVVNRIDVQHFDPSTGASKGNAVPLLTAAGDGSGIYINGAAIAPTGEIAIIYSAATGGSAWNQFGVYLAFLDKDLALKRTTQFVALASDSFHNQSHVQWLNGSFVASSVVGNSIVTIKVVKFGADGANAGSTSAIPTDDPSGHVNAYSVGEGEVAFSGGQFAVAYLNVANELPYLSILDTQGTEIGSPLPLPSAVARAGGGSFASVAGTSQGFVAVYNGTSPSSKVASLLATFASNAGSSDAGVSGSGDAGVAPIGATYSFPGGYAYAGHWSAGGSSDGTGAGFAVLYPDGSVSFLYFGGDGSTHLSPQTVLQQAGAAAAADEAHITNFAGNFAVSLYSSAEHLTRMVASGCRH